MLEDLIAFPQRARMPNLLIVGASGMGKTMIVEKFARDHPAHFDAVNGLKRMPVVVVQMVSGPDEARFYKRLLAAIGAPERRGPLWGRWKARVAGLAEAGRACWSSTRCIVAGGHGARAGAFPEHAAVSGQRAAHPARLRRHAAGPQRAQNRRSAGAALRGDRASSMAKRSGFRGADGSLQRTLPLRRESEIGERALRRIIEATGGVTAAIFSLMTRLAVAAVLSGEERIMGSEVEDAKAALALLGEAV